MAISPGNLSSTRIAHVKVNRKPVLFQPGVNGKHPLVVQLEGLHIGVIFHPGKAPFLKMLQAGYGVGGMGVQGAEAEGVFVQEAPEPVVDGIHLIRPDRYGQQHLFFHAGLLTAGGKMLDGAGGVEMEAIKIPDVGNALIGNFIGINMGVKVNNHNAPSSYNTLL